MSNTYPLLDLQGDLAEADIYLQDAFWRLSEMFADTKGRFPPGAATALANIATLRELLSDVLPTCLKQAIIEERTVMEHEANRWEPANY